MVCVGLSGNDNFLYGRNEMIRRIINWMIDRMFKNEKEWY